MRGYAPAAQRGVDDSRWTTTRLARSIPTTRFPSMNHSLTPERPSVVGADSSHAVSGAVDACTPAGTQVCNSAAGTVATSRTVIARMETRIAQGRQQVIPRLRRVGARDGLYLGLGRMARIPCPVLLENRAMPTVLPLPRRTRRCMRSSFYTSRFLKSKRGRFTQCGSAVDATSDHPKPSRGRRPAGACRAHVQRWSARRDGLLGRACREHRAARHDAPDRRLHDLATRDAESYSIIYAGEW